MIQWLALLKLPGEKLDEIVALGDYWDRPVLTERELRNERKLARRTASPMPEKVDL